MSELGGRIVRATLGQGAVTVALAVQGEGEELRVAKRLTPRFAGDVEARAMLRREARILAILRGRGAPRLVDQGEDDKGPFLVMERAALPSLATRDGARSPASVRLVARAALEALAEVHEASDSQGPLSIVHADLSPDNVLVAEDGREARIIDFGLASFRDDPGPPPGPFRGTLAFAAPEVARGAIADARSDLFALGATLLAVASSRPPRQSREFAALLTEAADGDLGAYAAGACAGLDPTLADVLAACVRRGPESRPRSARQALDMLAIP